MNIRPLSIIVNGTQFIRRGRSHTILQTVCVWFELQYTVNDIKNEDDNHYDNDQDTNPCI